MPSTRRLCYVSAQTGLHSSALPNGRATISPLSGLTNVRFTTLEKVLYLRKVPLFSEMGGRELRQVAEIATEEEFLPKTTIFAEGDPGSKLYTIVQGDVDIVIERNGQRTVLAVVGSGGFFGEMSIFDREPRSASIVTRSEVSCLTISSEDFRELVYTFPSVVFPILQHISRNLRRANLAGVKEHQPNDDTNA